MNHNFYDNPIYPNTIPDNFKIPKVSDNNRCSEEIFIDNIIKNNRGKKAKIYVTIPTTNEWQGKVFEGIIESANKDHIIISNPSNGEWNLIPMMYLGFVTIEENMNYDNY